MQLVNNSMHSSTETRSKFLQWKYMISLLIISFIIAAGLIYYDISKNITNLKLQKINVSLQSSVNADSSLKINAVSKMSTVSSSIVSYALEKAQCSLIVSKSNDTYSLSYTLLEFDASASNINSDFLANVDLYNINFELLKELLMDYYNNDNSILKDLSYDINCNFIISPLKSILKFQWQLEKSFSRKRKLSQSNNLNNVKESKDVTSSWLPDLKSIFQVMKSTPSMIILNVNQSIEIDSSIFSIVSEVSIQIPSIIYEFRLIDTINTRSNSSISMITSPIYIDIKDNPSHMPLDFNVSFYCSRNYIDNKNCSLLNSLNIPIFTYELWNYHLVNVSLISNSNDFISSLVGKLHNIHSIPSLRSDEFSLLRTKTYFYDPSSYPSSIPIDINNNPYAKNCLYLNSDNYYISSSCIQVNTKYLAFFFAGYNQNGQLGQFESFTRWTEFNDIALLTTFFGQYQKSAFIYGNATIPTDYSSLHGIFYYNNSNFQVPVYFKEIFGATWLFHNNYQEGKILNLIKVKGH